MAAWAGLDWPLFLTVPYCGGKSHPLAFFVLPSLVCELTLCCEGTVCCTVRGLHGTFRSPRGIISVFSFFPFSFVRCPVFLFRWGRGSLARHPNGIGSVRMGSTRFVSTRLLPWCSSRWLFFFFFLSYLLGCLPLLVSERIEELRASVPFTPYFPSLAFWPAPLIISLHAPNDGYNVRSKYSVVHGASFLQSCSPPISGHPVHRIFPPFRPGKLTILHTASLSIPHRPPLWQPSCHRAFRAHHYEHHHHLPDSPACCSLLLPKLSPPK